MTNNKDLEKIANLNSLKIKSVEKNEIVFLQELILLNSVLENINLSKIESRVVQYKMKQLLAEYIKLSSNKHFFDMAKDE